MLGGCVKSEALIESTLTPAGLKMMEEIMSRHMNAAQGFLIAVTNSHDMEDEVLGIGYTYRKLKTENDRLLEGDYSYFSLLPQHKPQNGQASL